MQSDPIVVGSVIHEGITLAVKPLDRSWGYRIRIGSSTLSVQLSPTVHAELGGPDGRVRRISEAKLEALIATLFEEHADG